MKHLARNLIDPFRRRCYRKAIPASESLAAIAILLGLMGIVSWVVSKTYSPVPNRDLPIQLIENQPPPLKLYKSPLLTLKSKNSPAAAPSPWDLFSQAVVHNGWTLEKPAKQYPSDNLYIKINGQAEQYLKYHCRELYFAVLKKGAQEITLEIYDHQSFANAWGVFSEQRGDHIIQSDGNHFYYQTDQAMAGVTGQYFYKFYSNQATADSKKTRPLLVQALQNKHQDQALPPPYFIQLQEKLGFAAAHISYQSQNVFQFDFARQFWFIKVPPDTAQIFFHRGVNAIPAQQLMDRIVSESLSDYDLITQTGNTALLRHKYTHNYFRIERQNHLLLGYTDALKRDLKPYRRFTQVIQAID